jgi:hypothetical protein
MPNRNGWFTASFLQIGLSPQAFAGVQFVEFQLVCGAGIGLETASFDA